MNAEPTLLEPQVFDADAANPLRVERSTWNGEERLDLRRMFYSRTGDLIPTKKGIGLEIKGGTARAVLDALRSVNGQAIHVTDPYGVIVVERRQYKGVPFVDVRRFYKGAPSHHGISLTADIEQDVVNCVARLLGFAEAEAAVPAPAASPAPTLPPAPQPSADTKLAARLRAMAAGLQAQIDDKTRPLTQNPTPKRTLEYAQRLHEGANLRRCQTALRLMADALEAGTLPPVLQGVKTKAAIYDLVRTRGESEGYYEYRDSQQYADDSPAGKALQAMLDGTRDPEAERQAQLHLLEKRMRLLVGQIPGFFPTPPDVVRTLIGYAEVYPGMRVLEPSAGCGNIADALREAGAEVEVCEVHYSLADILAQKGHTLVAHDFLEYQPGPVYARIVMNPPFERGQDIDHVLHAYDLLAPGGRLVSVMGVGVEFNSAKKYANFRTWLDDHGGWMQRLPVDAFKESGTGVQTVLVVVDK